MRWVPHPQGVLGHEKYLSANTRKRGLFKASERLVLAAGILHLYYAQLLALYRTAARWRSVLSRPPALTLVLPVLASTSSFRARGGDVGPDGAPRRLEVRGQLGSLFTPPLTGGNGAG